MGAEEIRLARFALHSRIILIVLQVIFNWCVPDHNAEVFQAVRSERIAFWDEIVSFFFEGFSRWDAQYFLHIALHGYTYENTVAFFPLFPVFICKPVADFFYFFTFHLISGYYCILIAGVCINVIVFILSTVILYRLSCIVLGSKEIAFVAALLFAINPASVFFSSCYSETLFSFTIFFGLCCLELRQFQLASLCFGFSACARSNGTLVFFFIAHERLKSFFSQTKHSTSFSFLFHFVVFVIKIGLYAVTCLGPFFLFQYYIYNLYCGSPQSGIHRQSIENYAVRHGYKLSFSSSSPWCNWTLPLSYMYVQEHYWNVGFLKYFDAKQLPNFLLATPILSIIIISSLKYFLTNRSLVRSLGLMECKTKLDATSTIYDNQKCFIYFSHAFLLSLFCSLFIHVQVSTRMLASSSPVLYWVAADLLLRNMRKRRVAVELKNENSRPLTELNFIHECVSKSSLCGQLCYGFFLSYYVVGTLLHVNYLPWT